MTSADAVGRLGIAALRRRYRAGSATPIEVMTSVLDLIESRGEDGVWISRVGRADVLEAAAALDPDELDQLPLFGIPFAVKDNVDVAGMETTAACPAFAYGATRSAALVESLLAAGALLIGKTNLDQFATGLNGTRSPYGTPSAVFGAGLIAGGSSSGSAVAVAAGLVSFSIGTDTAGSGRVPAALNNIVGMKPSIGLVSTRGVVPACRSLDCPSVFSLTVADGSEVLEVIAAFDPDDVMSRRLPAVVPAPAPESLAGTRFAIPDEVAGWGERGEEAAWVAFCSRLVSAGAELVPISLSEFFEAGSQLYGGAWLAERFAVIGPTIAKNPDDVLPVLRAVIQGAEQITGADAFAAVVEMARLRRTAHDVLVAFDALLTPTCLTTFTIAEMRADPVSRNARLGRFTTFTNLLDLAAIALPAGLTAVGVPFGVTIHAPAGSDADLARLAVGLERLTPGPPGAPAADAGLQIAEA